MGSQLLAASHGVDAMNNGGTGRYDCRQAGQVAGKERQLRAENPPGGVG